MYKKKIIHLKLISTINIHLIYFIFFIYFFIDFHSIIQAS